MSASFTVLHIPHASTRIPEWARPSLVPGDAALRDELLWMTDWFTDEIFDCPGAERVVFPASRLVLDPERFVNDDQEVMASRGMGVIYTRTSSGELLRPPPSTQERECLINSLYVPHHQRLAEAVGRALEAHGRALVIDCHSFPSVPRPYEIDQTPNRPEVCIGTDGFHTPGWLVRSAEEAFQSRGMGVEIDRPFSGTLVPSRYYRLDQWVLSVMVELRRDIYMDEATGERLSNFHAIQSSVRGALSDVVSVCRSR